MRRRRGVGAWLCLLVAVAAGPTLCEPKADTAGPFAKVDEHALRAPKEAEESVERLAAYLSAPAANDSEKARAIFRWITRNVDYDTEGFRRGVYGDLSPEAVLKRRTAVCAGYAALFERLARAAGLGAETVRGFSKGYGFTAGARLDAAPNHAWNAVKIDGRWRLLDCTWGAGHVTEGFRFVRKFAEHYFLTPPGDFLYDHFPCEAKWQLLTPPVSREEYEQLAYLRPAFFRCQLRVASHPRATIKAQDTIAVAFDAPADALLLSNLMQDGKELGEPMTLTQREGDRLVTRLALPRPGEYTLRLFARRKGEPGPYEWAVDYKVIAGGSANPAAGFPKTCGAFQERGVSLAAPLARILEAGATETFSLAVPGADDVAVVAGGKWTHLKKDGDRFAGAAGVKGGTVQVCARFAPDKTRYEVILLYDAK